MKKADSQSLLEFRKQFRKRNKPNLTNKRKPVVNILAACILRDAFGTGKQFGDYTVGTFIQSNSVFSLFTPPLSSVTKEKVLIEDMPNTTPCWHKWFSVNAEKTVAQAISEPKADYLIFGLTEVGDSLLRVENENGDYTLLDNSRGVTTNAPFSLPKMQGLKTSVISAVSYAKEHGGGTPV